MALSVILCSHMRQQQQQRAKATLVFGGLHSRPGNPDHLLTTPLAILGPLCTRARTRATSVRAAWLSNTPMDSNPSQATRTASTTQTPAACSTAQQQQQQQQQKQQQQQQQRPTDCINSRRPLRQSGIHFRLWKLPTNRIQS